MLRTAAERRSNAAIDDNLPEKPRARLNQLRRPHFLPTAARMASLSPVTGATPVGQQSRSPPGWQDHEPPHLRAGAHSDCDLFRSAADLTRQPRLSPPTKAPLHDVKAGRHEA